MVSNVWCKDQPIFCYFGFSFLTSLLTCTCQSNLGSHQSALIILLRRWAMSFGSSLPWPYLKPQVPDAHSPCLSLVGLWLNSSVISFKVLWLNMIVCSTLWLIKFPFSSLVFASNAPKGGLNFIDGCKSCKTSCWIQEIQNLQDTL